jgi:hypothetical protein
VVPDISGGWNHGDAVMLVRDWVIVERRLKENAVRRRRVWVMVGVGVGLFLAGVLEREVTMGVVGLSVALAGLAWLWSLAGERAEMMQR